MHEEDWMTLLIPLVHRGKWWRILGNNCGDAITHISVGRSQIGSSGWFWLWLHYIEGRNKDPQDWMASLYVSHLAALFVRQSQAKPIVLVCHQVWGYSVLEPCPQWENKSWRFCPLDTYIVNPQMPCSSLSTTPKMHENANFSITDCTAFAYASVLLVAHGALLQHSRMPGSSLLTISVVCLYLILTLTTYSWSPQLRKSRNSWRFSPTLSMHDRMVRTCASMFLWALPSVTKYFWFE